MENLPDKHSKTMSKDKDGASLERDGKYDEFIMEELKRLNAKVAEQNTELDQRI